MAEMRISEGLLRQLIREEIASAGGSNDRKVAIVIAGFTSRLNFAEHVRAVDGYLKFSAEWQAPLDPKDPLFEVLEHAKRISPLVEIQERKGLVNPMEFTRQLASMIREKKPDLAKKILREDAKSDTPGWGAHANWNEGMEGIKEGVKLMTTFLYGPPRNTRIIRVGAPGYLKGVRMIEDNIEEVDRYMELMKALPALVNFFVNNDDEDLEDTFIRLALGGYSGAVQAAMLIP